MDHDSDRRSFILGFLASAFGPLTLCARTASAAGGAVLDQPWAVWPEDAKPVRGGYFRIAAEQYIGKMNPNHWPVLDWVSMGYFHEKLMFTDGRYRPTVLWLAEQLSWEDPQKVLMRLRDGVTFQDGSPFDAESVKFQIDWIRDPAKQRLERQLALAARNGRGGRCVDRALEIQDALGWLCRRPRQRAGLRDVGESVAGGRGQIRQPTAGHRPLHA